MTMVVAELEKTLSSFPVVDSVVSLLDGVVEKLSALKRKVRGAALLYTRTQPPPVGPGFLTLGACEGPSWRIKERFSLA